jgi:hypothetical protein
MVLLHPIVYGLVHSEFAAGPIVELILQHNALERFRILLFQILSEYGGVNLKIFTRVGLIKTLWAEIQEVQGRRNSIVHDAESASDEDAIKAIEVASAILEDIFPKVVIKLGFHLHDGTRVCEKWSCSPEYSVGSAG